MQSDQGTCPACWSTEELPGAVCPQSAVAWGSSVSTFKKRVLSFTNPADTQVCTGSCRTAHWASQPSWEHELISRNDQLLPNVNCMVSTYEHDTSRETLDFKLLQMKKWPCLLSEIKNPLEL